MVIRDNNRPSTGPSATRRYLVLATVLLGVVAGVAIVASITRERIAANQRAWFVARLDALIPASQHDNNLYTDSLTVRAPTLTGSDAPARIYRARHEGKPVGAILSATAKEGYGGPIELLVAVDYAGKVLGVDILHDSETPGIGDGFLPSRSDWLQSLVGRSLDDTPAPRWTIRKDGGDFDQFTGASVTPRAILKAVRRVLEYYKQHRAELY